MPRNIQMLKQVRNAVQRVNSAVDDPNHKMQLAIADMFLNEIMLQDEPGFYLDFLAQGRSLVADGIRIAAAHGNTVAAPKLRTDLSAESRIEAINVEVGALNAALLDVVKALDESRSAEEKDFMKRVSTWESSLYLRRRGLYASTE